MTQTIAPYGSWKSPIITDLVFGSFVGLESTQIDGRDIYWTEMRPNEAGRSVIVRRTPDGVTEDCTPPGFNARSRVHEYGGLSFIVVDGMIYFSNFNDGRLYRQQVGGAPQPFTPQSEKRYADPCFDRLRQRLICVCEDHSASGEAVNTLVAIDLKDGSSQTLASGNNFYASPRLSPDGARLAWQTWNHPNMPWDGCELWVATVGESGAVSQAKRVVGGTSESIFQPEWSPDGVLYFASDRTGWWNLYRWLVPGTSGQEGEIEALWEMEAEFATPQWVFGMRTYTFEEDGRILCAYTQQGKWNLARLDPASKEAEVLDLPYNWLYELRTGPGFATFYAGSPTEATCLVRMDTVSLHLEVLRRSRDVAVDPGYLAIPQAIEFPTEDGLTAYGFYYPPHNKDFSAPASEKPPLLVLSHGGPTSATNTNLRLNLQYWTSRGFAVLDVNYGGSTGYGRDFRQRLDGQWGVVDMYDCANGARYLVEQGLADGQRLAITGGSAGGYTTLCALTFLNTFKAGGSHFGISDLEVFAQDTHKFESRYLDRLVGPYPACKEIYRQRSAINYIDRLSCPIILFQGLDDKVVPPNQAEMMFQAVRKRGMPVAYLAFPGEGHGFRRVENTRRALEAEFYFYSRVFGFEPADEIEPVQIENLPG